MKKVLLILFTLSLTSLSAQSWEELTNAPVGRHHPISFALDGKGYAVTGTLANGLPTNDVYQYDPATDLWLTLGDFPGAARSFGIGTVTNGKAYIGFGATRTQYLNDLWSFDGTDSSWTRLANCSCSGRRHPAMISVGDKIYVGLGDDATGNLRDWWMYDINTDRWSQIANLPGLPRHHPFMFKAGGELYAGMGHGNFQIFNDWYKLDTATNTWITMNDFPGEGRVAGTQFGAHGYGYVLSGDGDNHGYMEQGEMWRYDPAADSWSQLTSHPGRSRWAPGSFVIDSNVYFFGGLDRLTNLFPNDLWKFNIVDTTTNIIERGLVLNNTQVYPNPVNDILFWENDELITEVKIYSAMGQLLSTEDSKTKKINVSDFSEGMYFVQFYAQNELLKVSKVIIDH